MIPVERKAAPVLRTWVLIGLMAVLILTKGLFAFWVVGDHGQPTWDYRQIGDVPGQSAYAVYAVLPHAQHILGAEGE